MEEITIRLNDFLFNSGILGFIKVLENAEKEIRFFFAEREIC